jgi:hypothetical protein
MSARTDNAGTDIDESIVRFNGDTSTSYATHQIYGTQGVAVTSVANVSQDRQNWFVIPKTQNLNTFGPVVIEILDPFDTTKNTTSRAFSGYFTATTNYRNFVTLRSGLWNNTAALSSIYLAPQNGPNFVSGSRFSLYGIKARS